MHLLALRHCTLQHPSGLRQLRKCTWFTLPAAVATTYPCTTRSCWMCRWGLNGYIALHMQDSGPGVCNMYTRITVPTALTRYW